MCHSRRAVHDVRNSKLQVWYRANSYLCQNNNKLGLHAWIINFSRDQYLLSSLKKDFVYDCFYFFIYTKLWNKCIFIGVEIFYLMICSYKLSLHITICLRYNKASSNIITLLSRTPSSSISFVFRLRCKHTYLGRIHWFVRRQPCSFSALSPM